MTQVRDWWARHRKNKEKFSEDVEVAGKSECRRIFFQEGRRQISGKAKRELTTGPDQQLCGPWKINCHLSHQATSIKGESQASVRKQRQGVVL